MWGYLIIPFIPPATLLGLKLYIKLTTGWCISNVCLVGKTAIVTGANTGIGYETAEDFAKRGARVILGCRDSQRGQDAADQIIKNTNNTNVVFKKLDLASFKSVKEFAKDIVDNEKRLDILVNNAGAGNYGKELTEDGLLKIMQINYFGHFLLTNLLLDLMKSTPSSRIVNVSAIGAGWVRDYDVTKLNFYPAHLNASDLAVYARSKLCQILFTIELAERLKDTSVTTYSLHPGVILTDIFRRMPPFWRVVWEQTIKWFYKTRIEGAQTTIYCGVAKDIENLSGQHFHDCHVVKRYKNARDPQKAKDLWKESEKFCQMVKF